MATGTGVGLEQKAAPGIADVDVEVAQELVALRCARRLGELGHVDRQRPLGQRSDTGFELVIDPTKQVGTNGDQNDGIGDPQGEREEESPDPA